MRHGVNQSAGRNVIADKPCNDTRQHRYAKHNQPRLPQIFMGGVKRWQRMVTCKFLDVTDIRNPILVFRRISGRGQQREHDIRRTSCQNTYQHNHESLARRKRELLRRLRDGFKSRKGPWSKNHDVDNHGKLARPWDEQRLRHQHLAPLFRQRDAEDGRQSKEKKQGHENLHTRHQTSAANAYPAEQPYRTEHKKHFGPVDVKIRYVVMTSHFECIA